MSDISSDDSLWLSTTKKSSRDTRANESLNLLFGAGEKIAVSANVQVVYSDEDHCDVMRIIVM